MISKPDDLPSDLVSALAALQAEREARLRAEAMAASARAELSDNEALIAQLELRIEKLKRELHGQRSERSARLLEQLELELEELVTTASEDELAAQAAAAKTQNVRPFVRKRPVRKPWPDDIEHERVVIEAPTSCACCGGSRLAKVGEDVTTSSDRRGEHPQKHLAAFAGILQADCYNGFEPLFDPQKKALPITPAFCLAHARRGFFELADIEKNAREGKKGKPVSPIALEAVRRLDALFEIERAVNGLSADE